MTYCQAKAYVITKQSIRKRLSQLECYKIVDWSFSESKLDAINKVARETCQGVRVANCA